VSLSRATNIFDKHLFIASNESATSSARVSYSKSSGTADWKMRPTSSSSSLNRDGFFFAPPLSMPGTVLEKGRIVLWSIVCYMSGIVCLSPWQMLSTTNLSLVFSGLATCLPAVVAGPGLLSWIGRGCVRMMLQDSGVHRYGRAWTFLIGTRIQVVHCW